REHTSQTAINRRKHRRLAFSGKLCGTINKPLKRNAMLAHDPAVADEHMATINLRFDAVTGDRVEGVRLSEVNTTFGCAAHDGFGDGMFAYIFSRRDDAQ